MQAFEIENQKKFTGLLFTGDFLDNLLVHDIKIKTQIDVAISGKINVDFFEGNKPSTDYIRFAEMKPICVSLIKGKQLPLMFSIVLSLDEKKTQSWLLAQHNHDISNLYINIKYENRKLTVISACSYAKFSLDKDTERKWDSDVGRLLTSKEIEFLKL